MTRDTQIQINTRCDLGIQYLKNRVTDMNITCYILISSLNMLHFDSLVEMNVAHRF